MTGASLDPVSGLRAAFKRAAAAFLEQLQRMSPAETAYALLFEISDQSPAAWPIGATEESLSRLAATYQQKGYRARTGNDLEILRAALRWDAPGDDTTGWYWADEAIQEKLNSLLTQCFGPEYGDDDDGYEVVKRECLAALQELDQEGAFGTGAARDRLVIGITNVENEFESFTDELSQVNPPPIMARLNQQLTQGSAAWEEIDRQ